MLQSPHRRYARSVFPEYLMRVFQLSQMDFQYSASQMVNLCRSPSEVYKSTILRKQIKNQWARDDPAFVVLLIYFISLASFAYAITFAPRYTFFRFARMVVGSVCIEFLLVGIIISSILCYVANRHLKLAGGGRHAALSVDQDVEWLYAFDIHCNAFFPFFVLVYVVQFFMSPMLLADDFVACLLSNTLYAFACSYYVYITFLGYNALPFLQNTQRFLQAVIVIVFVYLIALLRHANASRFILGLYFGDDT